MNYDLKIFQTLDELSEYFALELKRQVDATPDKFNIALSGGNTPGYVFKYLAEHSPETIKWNKINFFWGDERCVPQEDNESNYKMAYDSLLSAISVPEKNIFPIKGEDDPESEAKRYSEIIYKTLPQRNKLPKFDLILLGLGEDGHIASIFPDQLHLFDSNNICAVAIHPATKQKRITITGKVINNAGNIFFIVTGKAKSKIVDDILTKRNNTVKYPAGLINPVNGKLTWLIDTEAAKYLRGNYN